MGLVITIWLLQWTVIIVAALMNADITGFLGRLRAALLQPAVWMLAGGCVAFLYAGGRAAANYDYQGTILAGVSFVFELLILIGTVLAALLRRYGGPDFTFGSARFATVAHAERHGLLGIAGIRLGYFRNPNGAQPEQQMPVHYTGQRHLLTVAPTRAGKGVSTIIPNLLTYVGSVIVIDPKGENARVTYDQRAKLGHALALDPWGISGKPAARFNPLAMLAPNSPTLIEDATLIAEALVIQETEGNGKHFSEQAADLIKGFLIYLTVKPGEQHTLGRLRKILIMGPKEIATIGIAMAQSPYSIVRAASSQFINKSENECLGVLSTAQRNTHFLDSLALQVSLGGDEFHFADLKVTSPHRYT